MALMSAPESSLLRRNTRLGVINGWLVFVGDGFFNVTVVVAGFASRLGASNAVIGLLPSIYLGGYMLPQLLVASKVSSLPYKLPVYRSAAGLRAGSYVSMVLISALLWQRPALCLGLFLLALSINALASGIAGLPFLEVVSKTIPAPKRAAFFALRNLVVAACWPFLRGWRCALFWLRGWLFPTTTA